MEVIMKMAKKVKFVLASLLLTIFAVSCSTTGGYMPLKEGEVVIGTVQETLAVKSTFFFMKKVKDAINTEAYIRLLDSAGRKYPDTAIDIRDILWVTGRNIENDPTLTEIFVTGKVIRIGSGDETPAQ
jgi:hypothetical protein